MAQNMGEMFQLAMMWMVLYGLLAFGWVHLRRVYEVEGGIIFGAIFYIYSVVGALGILYMFVTMGLRAMGTDVAFLKPVEDLVWNLSSMIQLIGVAAVVTGIVLFIARYFQNRRARNQTYVPPRDTSRRRPKQKSSKA